MSFEELRSLAASHRSLPLRDRVTQTVTEGVDERE